MRRFGETVGKGKAGKLLGVAIAALALVAAMPASADSLPPGSFVRNVASATYQVDGETARISSNMVATRIDEVLDLQLAPKSSGVVSVPTNLPQGFGVPFILTNSGSGTEAFTIASTVPGEAVSLSVAMDVDGNGAYDPAVDILLPSNGQTPAIAAGGRVNLLAILHSVPEQAGTIDLMAQAVTGNGPRTSLIAGQGDGGSDAIVGATTASASASVPFQLVDAGGQVVARRPAPATLAKSQTVVAPDGSSTAMSDAIITYRLDLTTSGVQALTDTAIADAIPAGTTYVPGSIRINDVAASDAVDSDAGSFDGAQIKVAFGDLNQPTTQVVTFQVKIQ